MEQKDLRALVKEIHRQKTERQNVELKACNGGFPKKIFDTLSAFSNQDKGGIMIFGMTDKPDFEIVGVYNAEDVQKKIMEACNQMEPKVRAVITVCEIGKKMLVVAEIPGVEIFNRPVFYSGVGRIKGSFVRVGDSDEPMSEYEVYSYEAFRKRIKDELRTVEHSKISMLDSERLGEYLQAVKNERKNLSENVNDGEILELMGVTFDETPTLAGIMAFSKYPQGLFPQLCITAVVVPGTEIGDTENADENVRFIDNAKITGAIPDMIEEAVEFVRKNSRTKTVIGEDGKRSDRTEYPMKAIREAVLNSVIHRDYSILTENIPVSIEMYRDRIVIRNPGGLYGTGTLSMLGKGRPETRNAALANILELMRVTENRYSGIPTMFRETKAFGLPPPKFEIRHGDFIVTFKNNIFNPEEQNHADKTEKVDISQAILQFCATPKSRAELVAFTGKSHYYTMSAIVQPLIDNGSLRLTIPEKPKSSKQRYVAAEMATDEDEE